MVLPRPAPALLLALGLPLASAGCAVQQPATAERAYHASMAPLVDRNAGIAQELETLAVGIKKGDASAEDIASVLDEKVLPEAKALATEVAAVEAGSPELKAAHEIIVGAWDDRADILGDSLAAWRAADADAAHAATERRYSAARAEALYFETINELLVQEGYVLQPYAPNQ